MKNKGLIAVTILFVSLAAIWLVTHPARAQTKTEAGETAKSTGEQYQRMLDEQAARLKRADKLMGGQEGMLDEQAARLKRADQLMDRQEELMKQQEAASKRYLKILETWEKQQQQHQKYLDSLEKK